MIYGPVTLGYEAACSAATAPEPAASRALGVHNMHYRVLGQALGTVWVWGLGLSAAVSNLLRPSPAHFTFKYVQRHGVCAWCVLVVVAVSSILLLRLRRVKLQYTIQFILNTGQCRARYKPSALGAGCA